MPPRKAAETQTAGPIVLKPITLETILVPITGTTEYISHRWSEKAKRMMLEKQQSQTRAPKEAKNPEADYESSIHRLPAKFPDILGRPGIPAVSFKAAMVGACRRFDGITMVLAKTALIVIGEGPDALVPIEGEPRMREDMVRLESGVADIRYRAGFLPWSAQLMIRYDPTLLRRESVVTLVEAAGQGGVGDWRPSAPKSLTGMYGMFQVARAQVETVAKESAA
jgi:hypothetical protein